MESRAPRGAEWADVVEVLHGFANVMTVRKNYAEGHPAIARADAAAAAGLGRVLDRVPELVLALLDGEFVVSERPLPELRARLGGLADAMLRHELDCIVFQKGITAGECALLGRTLAQPASGDPARLREETQNGLVHVLLRFAELKAGDDARRKQTHAAYLVPSVGAALYEAARAIAGEQLVDQRAVRDVAVQVVEACKMRVFSLEQRAYSPGHGDEPTHATNVALMTAAMALEAGHSDDVCVEAAAAAILHDVGQIFLSARIRGVPSPLLTDEQDKARFRHHCAIGAAALLAAGCPPLWIAAALEHHRGVDGGGYPTLATKRAPYEIVRMIALASYFDRKRTILPGHADDPDDVVRGAIALEDRYFGRAVVRVFLRALGAYPPGTTVELTTRQSAIVVNANPGDPLRPQVRLLFGENAGKRLDLKDLDAVEDRHRVSIARAILPPLALREERASHEARAEAAAAAPAPKLPTPPPAVEAPMPPPAVEAPTPVEAPPPESSTRAAVPPPPRVSVQMPRVSVTHKIEAPADEPARASVPPARILSSLPPRSVPPRSIPPGSVPPRRPSSKPPTSLEAIGPLDAIVKVALAPAELMKVALDPRAGFVISLVDGTSTLETLVDSSGLSEEVAAPILADLVARGILVLR